MKSIGLFILSFFIMQTNAQTFCDDLTILPTDSNTSQPFDTISLANAYSTIILNGDFNNWYYYSNTGNLEGISGDCFLNIHPNYIMEKVYINVYVPSEGTNYEYIPGFVINGDSSNSPTFWHDLSEFPMTVSGVDISVDTNLMNLPTTGSAFTIVLEGNLNNGFSIRSSFDLFFGSICYESEALDVDDIADLQSSMLFPNPTTGDISLKSGENQTIKSITVYDLLGHQLQTYDVLSDYLDFSIQGPKGIYMVSIVSENDNTEIIKVVKQ